MMDIYYDNRQNDFEITDEAIDLIKRVVLKTLEIENIPIDIDQVEISISFVNSSEMRSLNNAYRNVDSDTDVLSFPLNGADIVLPMLGDIVINTQRVYIQSQELGHSFERELAYLTCHSMLHLLGYDHIKDEDRMRMRAREKVIMKSLSIFKGDENEDREFDIQF